MSPKNELDELQVIFSAEQITVGEDTYVVKPWTLGQMVLVWPILTDCFKDVELKEATSEAIFNLLMERPQEIVNVLLPSLPKLLSISFNIPEEKANALDIGVASILALKMIGKNVSHLKNFFALAMKETMETVKVVGGLPSTTLPKLSTP